MTLKLGSAIALDRESLDVLKGNLPPALDSYPTVGEELSIYELEVGPLAEEHVVLHRHHEHFEPGKPILGVIGSTAYIANLADGSTIRARVEERQGERVAVVFFPTAERGERVFPLA